MRAILVAVLLSLLVPNTAEATWRCYSNKGVGHVLLWIPRTETINVSSVEQLVLSAELTDANNSVTLIEIEYWVYHHRVDPAQPYSDFTSSAGTWTFKPVKISWTPATDGKHFVLTLPQAYYKTEFRIVTANGADTNADVVQFRWALCSN